jgi:hypothetical protein
MMMKTKYANLRNRRDVDRAIAEQRARADLRKFQPLTPAAKMTLDDFLRRGASPVFASRDQVVLERFGQTATMDAMGRVVWA